jgi:hypothetical protein
MRVRLGSALAHLDAVAFSPSRSRIVVSGKRQLLIGAVPMLMAAHATGCDPAVQPTMMPWDAPLRALWERPADISAGDLLAGPWGADHAPEPNDEYALSGPARDADGRRIVVTDRRGRRWDVARPSTAGPIEGSAAVVLSRVLSAIGYHQPPVFYLESFAARDGSGVHREPGGRFLLLDDSMRPRGGWPWARNPFVGMRPYQGLLVALLLFDARQLLNSSNTLYDVARDPATVPWYVVSDLGSILDDPEGSRARYDPHTLANAPFVRGIDHGFVTFDYHGPQAELIRNRITPEDVAWTCALLAGLNERQWDDAFRAGGYRPDVAARFINVLRARIEMGAKIGADD